jgi:small subunit ribosomal protein S7
MSKLVVGSMANSKIEKIINYIMQDGKKSVARRIYTDMLKEIKSNGHMNPEIVLETAIENVSPNLMIKSKRMG